MAQQFRSRFGWLCFVVLVGGLSWLSVGCNPQTLSMLALLGDNNETPTEYKLFDPDKELTLVVLSNFKEPQIQEEIRKADTELADEVSAFLRKRCTENKHKLKLIPQAQVRSYRLRQVAQEGEADPVAIGRHFKADYVLHLEIESFSLYEKLSYPKMFRGHANIGVTLYKVKTKDADDDHVAMATKPYLPEYPGSKGPIPADGASPNQFRRMFLVKCSREITRMFIGYPLDEKRNNID